MKERNNPLGTDGFEFVEYTAPDTRALANLFENLGFLPVARHRSKDVVLYRQGSINFIINHEPDSFAQAFARVHGPSVCAFAIRVNDAAQAYKELLNRGARPYQSSIGPMELNIPAIQGIGGSLLYLVDRYQGKSIYDVDFVEIDGVSQNPAGVGLIEIDHLTHNVHKGRMNEWAQFYERLFDFKETRYFDIKGQKTGLLSRAMTSPCGKIRIPINEPTNQQSQIQEYLNAYHGEGIQHIALASEDIYSSIETLRRQGMCFMTIPDSYFELLNDRGAELPASLLSDPLMYQGASDCFLGPRDAIQIGDSDWGTDFEAEIAVITGDVPMGTTPEEARLTIRLILLVNDISYRKLIPAELAKGFGFIHGKPLSAFSPVAITPDELADAWVDGKLHYPLCTYLNGKLFGQPNAGESMQFNFPELISHAAKTRPLAAGTIIGSGTVSNEDASRGFCCILEQRVMEIIEGDVAVTPFLESGDRIKIDMLDNEGHSLFGAIEQRVE